MSNRSVRAGQTITLRARFLDDLGDPAEAASVFIHLFEPDADTDDLSEAHTVSGVATYFDQGIFEYAFAVPSAGPDGIWTDKWEGILTAQNLEATFEFEVSANGEIVSLGNQINVNNVVEVILESGIMDIDGVSLGEQESMSFMTTTTPSYTNIRKVKLEAGGFLINLEDDTIQTAILEGSLEADQLTFALTQNTALYEHARREWTTCKTVLMLMVNMGNQTLKSKTLDNLRVEYDTNGLRDAMEKAYSCMSKWEPQLMTGGYAKAAQNPQGVVKGECDPDRPTTGRLWHGTDIDPLPAANTKAKYPHERRWKSIFSKKRYW